MAQPPSPQAITGSLSFGDSGRNTTWPAEPNAGSFVTLYGPGIAFGAPSSGSVVLTRLRFGPCANVVVPIARTRAAEKMDNLTYASKQSSRVRRRRIIDHRHGTR